ncbi:MAG TPA: class I SAM-dependent methyltransferase [Drouetiella sp.]
MAEEELKKFFSKIAPQYDQYAKERIKYQAHIDVPQRLMDLHQKQTATVLDLACGTGLSSELFFQAGCVVSGVDFSPGMIEVARSHPYKELHCQSIEDDLPFADCSFDIVSMIGALEFVKAPAVLLKSICRVLKVRGLCALTLPQPTEAAEELEIITYSQDAFMRFVDTSEFELVDSMALYGWESGHVSELDGRFDVPRHKVNYVALFFRKL